MTDDISIKPFRSGGIYVTDTVPDYPTAHEILRSACRILAYKGFVTISDLADLFGRPAATWHTTLGWISLEGAFVEKCDNYVFPGHGYRINLPMPKDIYEIKKEKNDMNKSTLCKKCVHESCERLGFCSECVTCKNASHFVPKDEARFGSSCPNPAPYHPTRYTRYENMSGNKIPDIKDVIFNPPATIVLWQDGTKTVVKAGDDAFDPEKGLAMAISKKALGNKGSYYNTFKKWVEPYRAKEVGREIAELREKLDQIRDSFARTFQIPPLTLGFRPFQKPDVEEKVDEKKEPEEKPDPEVRSCMACKHAKVNILDEPCLTCIHDGFLGKDKSKFELAE